MLTLRAGEHEPQFRFPIRNNAAHHQRRRQAGGVVQQGAAGHPLRRLACRQGTTLIETIVAVGLFALTAATMSDFLLQQIRMGGANYSYSKAYALAAQEFEDMRSMSYDDMASRSSTTTEGSTTYTVQTTVLADTPEPNMKKITVQVSWTEPSGAKNVKVYSIYTAVQK